MEYCSQTNFIVLYFSKRYSKGNFLALSRTCTLSDQIFWENFSENGMIKVTFHPFNVHFADMNVLYC